jgi:uncharacterized protein
MIETSAPASERIRHWHLVHASSCNLRCSYCATDFGRMGGRPTVMSAETWHAVVEQALERAQPDRPLEVEWGSGEPFVHYDDWLRALDQLRAAAVVRGVELLCRATTNGTLLDERRLQELAARGVWLTFSIDAPATAHDRCRRRADGRGTFRAAYDAWSRYREITADARREVQCGVRSVIGPESSLLEATRFWIERGVPLVSCGLRLQSRYGPAEAPAERAAREEVYLRELDLWAADQASRLRLPGFLSDYRGPESLYRMWVQLFTGQPPQPCGAGLDRLAVDAEGFIYPCDAYIDSRQWCLGSVSRGLDEDKLRLYREARRAAIVRCETCPVRACCERSCFAAEPERPVTESFASGCAFLRRFGESALRNFALMEEHAV